MRAAVMRRSELIVDTVPEGPLTMNVPPLIVAGSIGSLKTAVMTALLLTPVAPFTGDAVATVGGVKSMTQV